MARYGAMRLRAYLMRKGKLQEIDTMTKLSLSTSLVLAALATTAVATPSFATWNDIPVNTAYRANTTAAGSQAYAAAPGASYSRSQAVVVDGQYVGADPDANVRLQLLKGADQQNY